MFNASQHTDFMHKKKNPTFMTRLTTSAVFFRQLLKPNFENDSLQGQQNSLHRSYKRNAIFWYTLA